MSDISLVRPHSVPIAEAKGRVQKAANELAAEHELSSNWHGNILYFERSGLHGEIHVTHSEVRVEATLGFLLKPMKAKLVDRLERTFEKLFPEAHSLTHAKRPTKKTAHH